MPKFKDRTGNIYGRLKVIKHAGKDHRNKHLWLCACDCGNEKVVVSDNLSSGKSNSCGCLKKEFLSRSGNQFGLYKNRIDAILKVQYHHIKKRHFKKFSSQIINFYCFKSIVLKPCFYCGVEYSRKIEDRQNESKNKKRLSDTIVKCNGIDRVDNSKGYEAGNCVPCCKICNSAKGTQTVNEFSNWIKNLNRNFIGIELDENYFKIACERIDNA